MSEKRCTCDVRPPRAAYTYGRTISGYAIYLSTISIEDEDDTRFDSACPFHGDEGTAVVALPLEPG